MQRLSVRRGHAALLLAALLALPPATYAAGPAPTEAEVAAKGARLLGARDYATLYVGNTLSGTTADGEPFHVFVESGSAYRMLFQGQRTADRWSVGKEDEFCATAGADTTCTREYLHGETIHNFNLDGTLAGTARIRPGNPERL